jgi:hypothetical protein
MEEFRHFVNGTHPASRPQRNNDKEGKFAREAASYLMKFVLYSNQLFSGFFETAYDDFIVET